MAVPSNSALFKGLGAISDRNVQEGELELTGGSFDSLAATNNNNNNSKKIDSKLPCTEKMSFFVYPSTQEHFLTIISEIKTTTTKNFNATV